MSFPVQELPSQANPEEGDSKTKQGLGQKFTSLVSILPSRRGLSVFPLYRHDKGWHGNIKQLVGSMVADDCFDARPSDIVVATQPKSGTTWIKALLHATAHRREHPVDAPDHPFHSLGPHECIKSFEMQLYGGETIPDLDMIPDPRLFATHVPYVSLPKTTVATTSGCKIVYVCRDPKDTLISLWQFVNRGIGRRTGQEPFSLETAADLFCDGATPFGPYWDHVLGYWHAHLARPEQVLFFRYEEMKRDPAGLVRRLADFVGRPFSTEEDDRGVVDAVVRLCSFEHMSGLEATKSGTTEFAFATLPNSSFFRRGMVGDWVNHLSPEMAHRIDAITEAKFRGSGLCF